MLKILKRRFYIVFVTAKSLEHDNAEGPPIAVFGVAFLFKHFWCDINENSKETGKFSQK